MVQLNVQFLSGKIRPLLGVCIGGGIGLFILLLIAGVSFVISYHNRIYPGIMIGPVAVGGLTKEAAKTRLNASVSAYQQRWPMIFGTTTQQVSVSLADPGVHYAIDRSVETAFALGRKQSFASLTDLANLLTKTVVVPLDTTINEGWLADTAASVAAQVNSPAIPPRLEVRDNQATIITGQAGVELNQSRWQQRIRDAVSRLVLPEPGLEMETVDPSISAEQATKTIARANTLLAAELTLTVPSDALVQKTWKLAGTDLVQFLQFTDSYNEQKLTEYVTGVATTVNREPQDAKFQFDETTGKVKEFVAPEIGITVDVAQTVVAMETALTKLLQQHPVEPVSLVIQQREPAVTLAAVNRLGIKERLGVGTSMYKGSIAGRVHNVELAASRLNGILIKPGETFSFNTAVGEVSAATGYQQAYIIQDGKTQLGDGGGLCQDSTTLFRAALNAGLPIVSRKGHAYRVGYYEQDSKPGFDATVFSPSTDLAFLNDTPAYLLLQTSYDSTARTLTFTLYGTSDGRKTTIKDYALWDVTPPPPDVYQDDPTLPIGTTKQVDWKAPGTKTKFTYMVERDGAVIFEKTFVTNYQPWASVYLRGTKQ